MAVNLSFDDAMRTLDRELAPDARVLVVGVGGAKQKYERALPGRDVVGLDIEPSHRPDVVADAHDLPFEDGHFQAVIAQAVLEHTHDPFTVAREIHRVLAPDGLVYSELPFMQQVHEGARDYMRFTLSGHRMLLRDFRELDAGLVAGPGTVMLWSVEHLFLSATNGRMEKPVKAFVRVAFCWLPLFDYLLRNRRSVGAASCTYFLGRRSEERRSVEDIEAAFSS